MVQLLQADPLLTERQAAEVLQVKPGTLQVWRSTGRYPLPFVKSGHLVRYRQSALEAFISERSVTASQLSKAAQDTQDRRAARTAAKVAQVQASAR